MPKPGASSSSFHEQLRVLQSDITTLSNKLAIPGPGSALLQQGSPGGKAADDSFLNHAASFGSGGSGKAAAAATGAGADDEGTRRAVSKLRREMQAATRERDEALTRLDHAYREMEEMRRALQEAARLRATYDHLRQDHDALRISLESSERIRKQQKALIDLLQKSHSAHMSDSASVGSYSSSQYGSGGGGGGGGGGGSISSNNSRPYSLAAENREWLNASPARYHHGASVPGIALLPGGGGKRGGSSGGGGGGDGGDASGTKPVARLKAKTKDKAKTAPPLRASSRAADSPSVASTPTRASARPTTASAAASANGRRRPDTAPAAATKRKSSPASVATAASSPSPSGRQSPYLVAPSTPLGARKLAPSPSPAPNGRPPRPHSARPKF